MTAGSRASADPVAAKRRAENSALPFQPRRLSAGEATSRELFVFYSPRNQRIVKVCEYLHLAMALQLEFTPSVTAYVERPRRMALTAKHSFDVSFWVRHAEGMEQYLLGIPKAGTTGNQRDGAVLRDRTQLESAAQRHGVPLTYVLEQELLSASAQLRSYFLLLPHVQHVRRVIDRTTIRQGVRAILATSPRVSFRQLTTTLDGFTADEVIAVAASMVHDGTLQLVGRSPLSLDSMLEVRHDT